MGRWVVEDGGRGLMWDGREGVDLDVNFGPLRVREKGLWAGWVCCWLSESEDGMSNVVVGVRFVDFEVIRWKYCVSDIEVRRHDGAPHCGCNGEAKL